MSEPSPAPPLRKRGSCLKVFVLSLLFIGAAAGGLVWWQNRPIQPVILTADEKTAVERKIDAVHKPEEPHYEKGGRDIVLTEREINGLINDQTDLGRKLKIELGRDSIYARLEMDLDPDVMLIGGRHLKARARVLAKTEDGVPSLVVDDVTVWGVSLPNAWLGNLKGQDLFRELLEGEDDGRIPGIESIKVEPGQLRIRLQE